MNAAERADVRRKAKRLSTSRLRAFVEREEAALRELHTSINFIEGSEGGAAGREKQLGKRVSEYVRRHDALQVHQQVLEERTK